MSPGGSSTGILAWLKTGALREIDYDDPIYRRLQKGLEVDGQKRPNWVRKWPIFIFAPFSQTGTATTTKAHSNSRRRSSATTAILRMRVVFAFAS
jgi:hypothetical protein